MSGLNLEILQAVDFKAVIAVKNVDGSNKDLTGWSVEAAAEKLRDTTVRIDLEPEISDEEDSEGVVIEFSHTETAALSRGVYQWDLILTDPDGKRWRPMRPAQLKVERTIT